jgi:hypothetical protein
MSMDNTGFTGNSARTSDDNAVTDAPLMAATPIWETRGKKRRGMGRAASTAAPAAASTTAAAETRSFEPIGETPVESRLHETRLHETRPMAEPIRPHEPSLASTAAVTDPMTGRPDLTVHDDDAGLIAPIGRTRTTAPARRSGAPMAAIAAGVVALGAVGAAGWYATRGDDGVAELTPGAESIAVAQAPAAPMAPMTGGADPASTTAATSAATAPMAAAATPARTSPAPVRTASRARPASSAAATGAVSASEQGIDASGTATLPAGPQSYSTLNGGTTDTPAATGASGVTTAPATATPAPMPSTPPIVSTTPAPAPESTAAEPAAPSTVTPPQ